MDGFFLRRKRTKLRNKYFLFNFSVVEITPIVYKYRVQIFSRTGDWLYVVAAKQRDYS